MCYERLRMFKSLFCTCTGALGPSYGDLTWLGVRLGNCFIGPSHCSKSHQIYRIVTPQNLLGVTTKGLMWLVYLCKKLAAGLVFAVCLVLLKKC